MAKEQNEGDFFFNRTKPFDRLKLMWDNLVNQSKEGDLIDGEAA